MPNEASPAELVHQRVRDRLNDIPDGPGKHIACGADINTVKHSSVCAHATCPECLKWQEKVTDAVFTPLARH